MSSAIRVILDKLHQLRTVDGVSLVHLRPFLPSAEALSDQVPRCTQEHIRKQQQIHPHTGNDNFDQSFLNFLNADVSDQITSLSSWLYVSRKLHPLLSSFFLLTADSMFNLPEIPCSLAFSLIDTLPFCDLDNLRLFLPFLKHQYRDFGSQYTLGFTQMNITFRDGICVVDMGSFDYPKQSIISRCWALLLVFLSHQKRSIRSLLILPKHDPNKKHSMANFNLTELTLSKIWADLSRSLDPVTRFINHQYSSRSLR
ncbi:hypothetical protein P9112_011668 [Eukaryota sp. TZLM1-RC]